MTDTELVKALWRIAVQDTLKCTGCGYEHNCSIHGCAIIKAAARRINELDTPRDPAPLLDDDPGFVPGILTEVEP